MNRNWTKTEVPRNHIAISHNLGYGAAYDQVERDHWNSKYTQESLLDAPRHTHPKTPQDYYDVGGIEVIDYIRAKLTPEQYKGYLLGNIYKYSGRLEYKGEAKKDSQKLTKYTEWLSELYDNNI